MPGPERNRLPAMRTALGTTSAHPPWRCCRGSLHLRSPGESSRLQRHTTRKPWSLCRWPAWPDLDRGGCYGQEAQQETQASEEKAQAGWWAIRRPGTQRRQCQSDGRNVCSRAIPAMLQRSAMRPDRRERHRRDLLLRARGNVLHHRPNPAAPAPATSSSEEARALPAGAVPAAPHSHAAAARPAPTGTVAVAGTALSPVARILTAASATAPAAPACRHWADGARAMSIAAPATSARTATAPV